MLHLTEVSLFCVENNVTHSSLTRRPRGTLGPQHVKGEGVLGGSRAPTTLLKSQSSPAQPSPAQPRALGQA
ncbi:hypothetical protein E2C01_064451 [Portunus trituberculatus]|uniref:Uncharacterized protein n=1 Tax=Portunus trituberculatus TaxID=210409 RepID=A0A5B7HKD4_PORTR|nr:hypothetical protein [Portunus trituberculatus]